jgi:peptidoglycan/LPS O-acetylase OafA/YrhL
MPERIFHRRRDRTALIATGQTATGAGKDLPNLDVLRSVAVLTVLVGHIYGALSTRHYGTFYGAFAVGLFFVHTALVLMWSLERRPNTLDFYVRRIARIYPLAILVLLIAAVIHAKVNAFHDDGSFFLYTAPTLKQLLAHVLLIQNFFSGNFIVYPMWSLPIEVQMYVMLPVLFFFLRKNMVLWPLLIFLALAAGTAHHAFGPQEVNLAVAIPYFLPGVMAYVGFSRWKAVLPGWSFLIVLAAITWLGGYAGNWQRAWWPCLALGLALPLFRQLKPGVLTKVCWYIARYSYGIYLTHPFALLLGFYVFRDFGRPVQFAVLLGSLAAFSLAAYHLIEAPGMRLGATVAGAVARRFPMPVAAERAAR